MQRTSSQSIHLDCLQRSFPKAVKAFKNAQFLFLEIAALYKLTSEVSSLLLMVNSLLLMVKVFSYIELAPSRPAAMKWYEHCIVGYGIKISFPRPHNDVTDHLEVFNVILVISLKSACVRFDGGTWAQLGRMAFFIFSTTP